MQDTNDNAQALPCGTRLEEFEIIRVLGSGGFGITYLARDTRLGRKVIIKENLPIQFCYRDMRTLTVAPRHSRGEDLENFEWSMENFGREAAMLAALEHPSIVKVLRGFEAFGTAYFAMPFVEGEALDSLTQKVLTRGSFFSQEEVMGLLEHVLNALEYLHKKDIFHRDIKPGNILIPSDGCPVLIDFGAARQRLGEKSLTVVESPGYTPFEQLQSRGNVGAWSDLYALGATLYKILSGESPPKAMDRMPEDAYSSLVTRVDLLQRYSPDILVGIDCALALRIADRWQSAGEWSEALAGKSPSDRYSMTSENIRIHPDFSSTEEKSPAIFEAKIKEKTQIKSTTSNQAKRVIAILLGCTAVGMMIWGWLWTERNAGEKSEANSGKLLPNPSTTAGEKPRNARAGVGSPGTSPGENRSIQLAPGVIMTFCWIPPGEFMMGSPTDELGRVLDETQHQVTISEGFWMGKTEVTQKQWETVMQSNPSHFSGADLPVEMVSWNAIAGNDGFLEKLGVLKGNDVTYALPTEAQWEYACRAGNLTSLNHGKNLSSTNGECQNLDEVGWYDENSSDKTHPVGQKKANAWGLYDMHGNVREWCADSYSSDYASNSRRILDSLGQNSFADRVVRGGSWHYNAISCRAAQRNDNTPTSKSNFVGFRVVCSPTQ